MASSTRAVLLAYLLLLFVTLSAQAQDDTRLALLEVDSYQVQTRVPSTWLRANTDTNLLDIRSAPDLPLDITEWQHIALQIRPLVAPYGELPSDNRLGAYLELFAASLPIISAYPPETFSEIARFRWGDYPAAAFMSYAPQGNGTPAYYAWWVGVELDVDSVLLLELGTTLPDANPPTPATRSIFETALQNLRINDSLLPFEAIQNALLRLTDPLSTLAPPVASLRLNEGLEVRLAAPQGWYRRDVTPNAAYPSIYFLEDDVRSFSEGDPVSGAVIQVTLMSENYLARLLETENLPDELLIPYLNVFLPLADSRFSPQTPREFEWTPDYQAVRLPAEYGTSYHQDLILIQSGQRLILLTIYAPQTRWTQLRPIWQNILSSLTINGVTLPLDPLLEVYEMEGN